MKKEEKEPVNIIFLDIDGVINIKTDDFSTVQSPKAIEYLNRLCHETGFKIVVCSSWRDRIDYKEYLHNLGLDEKIEILGKTNNSNSGKEFEIMKYVEENDIGKYIVIDDAYFSVSMTPHHIQTAPRLGFTENKYLEALTKISKL